MIRAIAVSVLVALPLVASDAAAQQQQRFFYPAPPPAAVRVTSDVRFATADTTSLAMDVYRPAKASAASPALIFFLTYDPGRQPTRQSNDWIKTWARIAAAHGIVGIIPDIRGETSQEDFRRVVAHLTAHAAEYGVDRERLAVFSASGPVAQALPAVEDPRQTAIKAAVMYYGRADVKTFRLDLPVLYVRAGLDHPGMNAEIVTLAALAASQNAPLTLINHHTGHHGFEGLDDDDATRHVIDQTIEFVKRATAPAFQAAIQGGHLDAVAAGHLSTGNFRDAAATFAELMKRRPTDGLAGFRYAETLLADKQYQAACTEFRRPTSPSFAAIIPGTRSCVLAGSADSAMVWLQRFRKDWFKSEYVSSLRTDSVFAPLWGRAEFQALFK